MGRSHTSVVIEDRRHLPKRMLSRYKFGRCCYLESKTVQEVGVVTTENSGCASRAIRGGFAFVEQKKHRKNQKLRNRCSLKNQVRALNLIADGSGATLDLL